MFRGVDQTQALVNLLMTMCLIDIASHAYNRCTNGLAIGFMFNLNNYYYYINYLGSISYFSRF